VPNKGFQLMAGKAHTQPQGKEPAGRILKLMAGVRSGLEAVTARSGIMQDLVQ